jgi:uncharacterized repeat protein (TIGR03803 family)
MMSYKPQKVFFLSVFFITAFGWFFSGINVVLATGGAWVNLGSAGFSQGEASSTSIALDSNHFPYVLYTDVANSSKATVMKWNGATWETVGSAGFSQGAADFVYSSTSIAIDSNDFPYVAYTDGANSSKATVMKWNGATWETVGSAGFSQGETGYTSLVLDSNNLPYVVYIDAANSYKATVMKWNGATWETVGSAGFTPGAVDLISLALDSNDLPYVAYRDSNLKATVMKWNGATWETVGSAGFSQGRADYTSLALDSNDFPYVAYTDGANSYKATVMKWNGATWETVGSAGFSQGEGYDTSLTINSNDFPYVAYTDGANSSKATVMKWNGATWETVGSAGFTQGGVDSISLALDSNDLPYISYKDGANSYKATVMYFETNPIISSYTGSFSESLSNSGSILGSRMITVINDSFINPSGTLTEGVHYNLINKPAGLTAIMAVDGDGEVATLTFTGNATNHAEEDSINDLTITFLDGAFTNTADASDVINYTNDGGVITFITVSTLTVNSILDDGDGTCDETCTLRDAVESSEEGDTVSFEEGLEGTINLDDYIEVDHTLTIIGSGKDLVSIDACDNMCIYQTDGDLTISDLTFSNGTDWPALDSQADNLTIDNVNFINNSSDNDYGGALYFYGTGNLEISNSTFDGNSATTGYGGALEFDEGEDLIITNSTFANNSASDGSYGGAMEYEGQGNVIISNSTFANNSAPDGGYGGAGYFETDELNITNSTFYNNSAGSYGGAIYIYANTANITNSTFYNNSSDDGGAIYNDGDEVNVVNSIFYGTDNCSGDITSLGHNIDSGDTCGFEEEGDVSGVDGYEVLHEFDYDNGGFPYDNALLQSNGKFYGTTYSGGADDYGVIFEYDQDLDAYTVLHEFDGDNGSYPYNTLTEDDGKFYGTTNQGGADGAGVIFEYDPEENIYTVLHEFNDTDGKFPDSSLLIKINNKFYGVTPNGGTTDDGVIFEYDPANIGSEYSVLHEFDGDNGSRPYAFTENSGKFYGVTTDGGATDDGVIFEYDPTENEYLVLHEFDGDNGGGALGANLVVDEGKLYGMANEGGLSNYGVIFEYDLGLDIYTVLHEFDYDNGNGSGLYGSLTLFNGNLYGMTYNGGADDSGVIFEYNPDLDIYTVLHEFDEVNGQYSYGNNLTISGDKLYGMTYEGGSDDVGVIFSFDPNPIGFDPDRLQDNGGSTQTIALLTGSPAIDAGDDEQAPELDQRGYTRVGVSDIGAYEYGGLPPEEEEEDLCPNIEGTQTSVPSGKRINGQGDCVNRTTSSGSSPTSRTKTVVPPTLPPTDTPSDCLPDYLFSPSTGKPCGTTINSPLPLQPTVVEGQPACNGTSTLLKQGITSPEVKCLQQYLNTHGFPVSLTGPGSLGQETNFFGTKTKVAVVLFQKAHNLVPDGIVGPKTKAVMI